MRSALRANSRATRVTRAGVDAGDRLLPRRACTARRVVVAARPLARQPVAARRRSWAEQQVEHRGHELAADPHRRDAAAHRRRRPRRRRRRSAAASTSTSSSWRPSRVSAGSSSPSSRFQRPSPSSPQRKPIEPFGTTGSPVRVVETTVFHSAFSPASPRSRARRKRSATHAPSSRSRSVTSNGRSVKRARVVVEARDLAVDVELLQDHVAHRHRQRAVGARPRRAASGRRTWCARRSRARRRRPSGRGSAPRS